MRVGYVVLYVQDAAACRDFWIDAVGMVEKHRSQHGEFTVAQVGFADQPFAFELVPLAMMADNPFGLDLAAPSVCLHAGDLAAVREGLLARGVEATEIADHGGRMGFAFPDPEGRWFAVTEDPAA